MLGRYTACWFLPDCLAWYMAMSALRSSTSGSSPPCRPVVRPMLAPMNTSRPSTRYGLASSVSIRPATCAAYASSVSSSSTANSSPPRRAVVSAGRSAAGSRRATWTSRSSPAWWPRLSLMVLKSSRSTKSTATSPAGLLQRSSACWSRSANRARLARPVSSSQNARRCSSSASCRRSVTSSPVRTTPATSGSASRFWAVTWKTRYVPSRMRSRQSACAEVPRVVIASAR